MMQVAQVEYGSEGHCAPLQVAMAMHLNELSTSDWVSFTSE